MTPVSRHVMNLSHMLRQAARRFPDRPGLVWGDTVWTWRQIDARVDAMAAALAARGVRKGDRVLVQSRNCNQIFESMFACFRAGAVWSPVNFRLLPSEVAALAVHSGASVMLAQAEFSAHAYAARAASPALTCALTIGRPGEPADYETLVATHMGATVAAADVDYDDPCWFFFTSGTTGRSKIAVLTHGQLAFVITNHLCDLMPGTTEHDASVVVAPLSHGAGMHQLTQVARGACTVLPAGDRLDAGEVWTLVAQWRVTNMFTVPTILNALVEHPAAHGQPSLRYVIYAGAPMYRDDQRRALSVLGPVLVQYYGLGEVTGNITVLPPSDHAAQDGPGVKLATCGRARTGMQISIQDPEGKEVAADETGEICVCGPAVFAGYHDNPEANAAAFRNGWFRTGDVGHMDAEGDVFITGRASDMYISGGSNIYPREIEEAIMAHPAIAEAAVVGMPDPRWGESGVAVCVLRPGEALDEPALLAWLDGRVARYKQPRRVVFWGALPRSGYGKVTKRDVRAALEAARE